MARKSKDPTKPSKTYLAAHPTETPAPKPAQSKGKGKEDALRKAIRELGGDDEDYELVKGIESDDEVIEPKKASAVAGNEKELKNELSAFLKGLNFAAVAPSAEAEEDAEESEAGDEEEAASSVEEDEEEGEDEEEEEEEEEDEDEEESEASEESSEEEEAKPAPVAPIKAKAAPVPAPVEEVGYKIKSGLAAVDGRIDNIPQTPIWYTLPLPELPPTDLPPTPPASLAYLHAKATSLLQSLPSTSLPSKSSTDKSFLTQILASGTHQDKLSALLLLVRESPVHRVEELERLRVMAGGASAGEGGKGYGGGVKGGGGREERLSVLRGLGDWWVSGGGKESGKLRYFADQPLLSHPGLTDRHLLMFAFEDWLKKWFFSLLQIIETYLHDTLPFVRTQTLALTYKLLAGNAEQEQNLLRLGVNKLGDTDKSVASKASHHLLVLLQSHPSMKSVVLRELSTLVLAPPAAVVAPKKHIKFDPTSSGKKEKSAPAGEKDVGHARYYGLITMNQMTLTVRDKDVAGRMVEVYFEVFREILGSGPSKPAAVAGDGEAAGGAGLEKVTGKVEKWQGRRKGTRQARQKGKKAEEGEVEEGDSKLISAVLTGVNRALPFAKLDEMIFEKHAETLFRITHAGTFNTSIRALMLLHQVAVAKESISDRFYRTLYESLLDPRLNTSNKQPMYLNLLFKAIKEDTKLDRVMAFVKRLLQVMMGHQPPFICGAMWLLGELFSTTAGLKTLLTEPEDSGVEHFVDAPEKDAADKEAPVAGTSKVPEKSAAELNEYDGRKRDPQFANARGSCLWELIPFTTHFHPSVSLQATQLLHLTLPLSGSSDISQNTLITFLDRFVYRNPKKHATAKGASIMQPAAALGRGGGLGVVRSRGAKVGGEERGGMVEAGYVNDAVFWKKKVVDVPADQLFFHKFFNFKLAKQESLSASAAKRKKSGRAGSDDDAMNSDEEEEKASGEDEEAEDGDGDDKDEDESDPEEREIWKAMKASMPQVQDDMDLMEDSEDEEMSMSSGSGSGEDSGEEEEEEEGGDGKIDDADFEGESDAEDFGMDEDSDDLLSMDEAEDIPLGAASDEEEEEEEEDEATTLAGQKRKRREEQKKERKKRKGLPLLASAEDYRKMIDEAEEENV